jgi:phage terminase large subunit
MAKRTREEVAEQMLAEEQTNPAYESEPEEKEFSVEATDIFFRNQKSKAQILINRGGAGSSKSHSIAQLLLYKFFTEDRKKILILRKSLPSLRISALPLMNELASLYGLKDRVLEEKVHLNWYYNGALIHFGSLDDPEKIKCFHPDTDVLTSEGWKNVAEVKVGDLAATMDPITRKTYFKPVTKSFAYDYKGEMFEPSSETGERSTSLKFSVTKGHKMLVSTNGDPLRFEKIEKLSGKSRTKFARYTNDFCEGNLVDYYDIPKFEDGNYRKSGRKPTRFPIVSWLKFLGWFLSEGCASRQSTYSIHIAQSKEVGRLQIEEDLKDFPYHYKKDATGFNFSGKDLKNYLRSAVGTYSDNKRIPRDIMNLHPSLLVHLFNALIAGDGMWWPDTGKGGDYKWTYSTNSRGLADDVAELGFKLGYSISGNESKTAKGKVCWVVRGFQHKDSGFCKLKKVPYEGKVYCVEVPPYHTLVTKFSQVIVITGNSSEWNYIWLEEATEFTYDDFKTVKLRLRAKSRDGIRNQMYLSFNPIDEFHWIKEQIIDGITPLGKSGYDFEELLSTYKDNPYLPPDAVKDLEQLQDQDISFYNIYALGNWGKLENLVYSNWDVVNWMPDETAVDFVCYGLDFGYNDPSALVKCMVRKNEVWEEQKLYHTGLTNSDLIVKLQNIIPAEDRRRHVIYADSQEPDRIKEIKDAGFLIKLSNKLVLPGIDCVKRFNCHIYAGSDSIIKEKRAYSWRKDRQGNLTDEPVDFLNHLMDAERYALYTSYRKSAGVRVRYI